MPPLDSIRRGDVIRTIAEYDRLGRDTFLSTHGFGNATEYVLMHEGYGYDSKAIVGVAHRYATGRELAQSDFNGDHDGAAKVLRDLGFVVRGGETWETGEYTDVADAGVEPAQEAWLQAAREALVDTAKSYQALVTTKELGALVLSRTRIRTSQQTHHWVADILRLVARDCAGRDEPILSSLTVNANGTVGSWYAEAIRELRARLPPTPTSTPRTNASPATSTSAPTSLPTVARPCSPLSCGHAESGPRRPPAPRFGRRPSARSTTSSCRPPASARTASSTRFSGCSLIEPFDKLRTGLSRSRTL